MKALKNMMRIGFSTTAPEFHNYYILQLNYFEDGYYATCMKSNIQIIFEDNFRNKSRKQKKEMKERFQVEICDQKNQQHS